MSTYHRVWVGIDAKDAQVIADTARMQVGFRPLTTSPGTWWPTLDRAGPNDSGRRTNNLHRPVHSDRRLCRIFDLSAQAAMSGTVTGGR